MEEQNTSETPKPKRRKDKPAEDSRQEAIINETKLWEQPFSKFVEMLSQNEDVIITSDTGILRLRINTAKLTLQLAGQTFKSLRSFPSLKAWQQNRRAAMKQYVILVLTTLVLTLLDSTFQVETSRQASFLLGTVRRT
jgi:hypothetical protein